MASVVTHDVASGTNASTSAATCNGASSATGARHLFWRCVIDATTTTATPLSATSASSDYFPFGITATYGMTGRGD